MKGIPTTSLQASDNNPWVLVVVGPTCSGKSAVGLELARRLQGEIVSADSRQVFKYLDIGTAKPTEAQRRKVKHYFVDEMLPDEDFNAGNFGDLGREVIARILSEGRVPIVVGGSGLYVQSLIDGFFDGPGADEEVRKELERRLRAEGLLSLMEELRRVDPETAARIDPTKPRRVIRALEVYHVSGMPLSTLHREKKVRVGFVPLLFGLRWKRGDLYRRIESRCDEMIAAGLLDEVERLEAMGYTDSLNALNSVGYAEAFAYRRGETSYEEFVRLFKQNTRRYAKRQVTWFRRDERIRWIEMVEGREVSDVADDICRGGGILPNES